MSPHFGVGGTRTGRFSTAKRASTLRVWNVLLCISLKNPKRTIGVELLVYGARFERDFGYDISASRKHYHDGHILW